MVSCSFFISQVHYLKTDFEKWRDEDDSEVEEQDDFNLDEVKYIYLIAANLGYSVKFNFLLLFFLQLLLVVFKHFCSLLELLLLLLFR